LRGQILVFWRFIKAKVKPFLQGATFFRLGETFFSEAAVLWFVFPLLGVLYPDHGPGEHFLSWLGVFEAIAISWPIAGLLFIIGLVFGFFAQTKTPVT
jgi:hypothetical protein